MYPLYKYFALYELRILTITFAHGIFYTLLPTKRESNLKEPVCIFSIRTHI